MENMDQTTLQQLKHKLGHWSDTGIRVLIAVLGAVLGGLLGGIIGALIGGVAVVATEAYEAYERRKSAEKKYAPLRIAVQNVGLPSSLDEDIQTKFHTLRSTLTASHMTLLAYLDNPWQYGERLGVTYPRSSDEHASILLSGPDAVLEHVIPEMAGHYKAFLRDLYTHELVTTDNLTLSSTLTFEGLGTQMRIHDGHFDSYTTDLGKQFLAFMRSEGVKS
jgi:hypothetical protein